MIYELDVSKWVCGGGDNSLGEGYSGMLNSQGYMCCLGQFASQKGVTDKELLNRTTPYGVDSSYDELFVHYPNGRDKENTPIASRLMDINDNGKTTPIEKIAKIRAELKKCGHGLRVINEDLLI